VATYEHVREGRRITVSGAVAEEAYAADQNWREVKELTPKERLQADARELGVDDSGTVPEITARFDAKVAELIVQAKELEIDVDKLSAVDLLAAVDAKLAE
jgi:hypothetical protein